MSTESQIVEAKARLRFQLDSFVEKQHAEVAEAFRQSRRDQGLIRLVPSTAPKYTERPRDYLFKAQLFKHDGRPLEDYPEGTRAISNCGSFWYRSGYGWRWNGTSFHDDPLESPGASWNGMLLLPTTLRRDEVADMYNRTRRSVDTSKSDAQ